MVTSVLERYSRVLERCSRGTIGPQEVLEGYYRYSRGARGGTIGTREVLEGYYRSQEVPEGYYRYSRGTRGGTIGTREVLGREAELARRTHRHEDYFYGNKVVMTGSDVGGFTCRSAANPTGVPHVAL